MIQRVRSLWSGWVRLECEPAGILPSEQIDRIVN
jgi:hypothetical protein